MLKTRYKYPSIFIYKHLVFTLCYINVIYILLYLRLRWSNLSPFLFIMHQYTNAPTQQVQPFDDNFWNTFSPAPQSRLQSQQILIPRTMNHWICLLSTLSVRHQFPFTLYLTTLSHVFDSVRLQDKLSLISICWHVTPYKNSSHIPNEPPAHCKFSIARQK